MDAGDKQVNSVATISGPGYLHTGITVVAVVVMLLTTARYVQMGSELDTSIKSRDAMQEWCELVYAHVVKHEDVPHCPK